MRYLGVLAALALCASLVVPWPGVAGIAPESVVAFAAVLLWWLRVWGEAARRGSLHDRRDPVKTAWVVLVLVAVASMGAGPHRWAAILPVVSIASAAAAHWMAGNGTLDRTVLTRAALPALLVALALSGLANRPDGDPVTGIDRWAATAGMGIPLAFGALTARGRLEARVAGALAIAALGAQLWMRPLAPALFAAAVGLAFAYAPRKWGWPVALVLLVAAGLAGTPRDEDRARVETARAAAAMIVDRPVVGFGPGSFLREFPAVREPGPQEWSEVPNAACGWVHVGAEQGAAGLAGWALLLYVFLRRWWFFARHQEDADAAALVAGCGGAVAGFAAANVGAAAIVSVPHLIALGMVTGAMEYLGNRRPLGTSAPMREAGFAAFGGLTLILLFGILVAFRAANADLSRWLAQVETDPQRRMVLLEESLAWDYRDWRTQADLGRIHLEAERPFDAAPRFEEALRENPNHLPSLLGLIACYEAIGTPEKLALLPALRSRASGLTSPSGSGR